MKINERIEKIKDVFDENKIEEIATEIFENLNNWSMHMWIDVEGNHDIRQDGCFAEWEDEVLITISVNAVWWNYDIDAEGNDTEEHREDFINYAAEEVQMEIDNAIDDYRRKLEEIEEMKNTDCYF